MATTAVSKPLLRLWQPNVLSWPSDSYEDARLARLAETVPDECCVTVLADRGFGKQKLFAYLAELGFGNVIRFRGNIRVANAGGQTRSAAEWVAVADVPASCATSGSRPRNRRLAQWYAFTPRE